MPSQPIGLVAHSGKPRAAELVKEICVAFRQKGQTLLLDPETAPLAGEGEGVPVEELGRQCRMVVVLGGDGSLLRLVHQLGRSICPVFGINHGSLGFLTCVNSLAWPQAVDAICSGEYVLSHRSLLSVTVEREGREIVDCFGLNDVVISRGRHSRLIRLDTAIDGIMLTQYNADGLIIATPTGSTAYSLSAGGPVMMPESGVFVITPICPHVLTNRSLIVGDQSELVVSPAEDQHGIVLAVDGQEPVKIRSGDRICLRKSPLRLPLAMLPRLSFPEVLREKLKWSGTAI